MSTLSETTTLRSIIDKDGKKLDKVSLQVFILLLAFIPLWAVTILPLSITYQIGMAIRNTFVKKKKSKNGKGGEGSSTLNDAIDSGYEVKESDIIPQKDRKYDMIFLGASGFTGQIAVSYLVKNYGYINNKNNDDKDRDDVRWAIAGRNKLKLQNVLRKIEKECNMEENELINNIDIVIVDTNVPSTMPNLVSNTRVVATTAGPYQKYGSSVVEFCVKYGTHYVDITGEVDWVRTMMLKWEETAKKTGSVIVSCCGCDSIPWDLSVMALNDVLNEQCDDEELVDVTFWDEFNGAASGGTMATMFIMLAEGGGMKPPKCNFDPLLRLQDGTESPYKTKSMLPYAISSSSKRPNESRNVITAPFPLAPGNYSIVKRNHALRKRSESNINKNGNRNTLTYKESAVFPDYKTAIVNYLGLFIFGTAVMNPITKSLVEKYVLPKPGTLPATVEEQNNKFFVGVVGEGIGSDGSKVESFMYFDKCPGYISTARMLVESGLCFTQNYDTVPCKDMVGGFYPPSIAFGDTLLNRLCNTGTHFKTRILSHKSSQSTKNKKVQ